MKLISSKKFKEFIIRLLLAGKCIDEIGNKVSEFFIENKLQLFNQEVLKIIMEAKQSDNKIIIITSNLDLFINPVKNVLDIDEVFSTKVKTVNNKAENSIDGNNCSGIEKEKILKNYVSKFLFEEVISFGDSSGDYEMLKVSDKSFLVRYSFNSIADKIRCILKYLNGKICSEGFEVSITEFHSKTSGY